MSGRDDVRAELLAKIEAEFPRYRENSRLVREIELASHDDLRKHLAWAEELSDTTPLEAGDWIEPSPRMSAGESDLMRKILSSRNGVVLRTGEVKPPHTYILAIEECEWYSGPSWVPFNLWQVAEYGGNSSLERICANKLLNATKAQDLWSAIASKYSEPDMISVNLAAICANAEAAWQVTPRDTPSYFRDGRERLARSAEKIAHELERFYLPRDEDEHELPGLLDFTQLLTREEEERFDQAIRITTARIVNGAREMLEAPRMSWEQYNESEEDARYSFARMDAHQVYALLLSDHSAPQNTDFYGGVPTLPDLLRRIAKKFREDADLPPLSRPNLANAKRNFFTRAICKYFWRSFGDVSPAIVRDIVSVFFDQGIGENEVSQILAKVKRDYPLPADPESSTRN
jgi:hypothetical protein